MIHIKTEEEIKIMAEGGKRLAEVLLKLKEQVMPGISTAELDRLSRKWIEESGAKPAFLGYRPSPYSDPFPFTLCASLNSTVVHGLPSDYQVKEGDLLKLDLGLIYKGYYSDSAVTVGVGEVSETAKKLMTTTEESMYLGIKQAKAGNTLGDIGHAIQSHAEGRGFAIADLLTGHGIGKHLHEDPSVLNTGKAGAGDYLEVGMVIAIEPMVIAGYRKVKEMPDGSFVSKDGSVAAHFEHTVAITENGPRILTKI